LQKPLRPSPQATNRSNKSGKTFRSSKGLPDSQLFLLMNFVGDSLGVNCDYCHVKGEKNPHSR
jgi:hypothetical protein